MAPVKRGKYEYRPDSLVHLRQKLGRTQVQMAKILGIPSNTLSRWETGATTPDAGSLAAIYSVGMEHKIQPDFFRRRRAKPKTPKGRSRLLVMWDFQNLSISAAQVKSLNAWIRQELDSKFPNSSYRCYKAFAAPHQAAATDVLMSLGWSVWEDDEDFDHEIISHAKSDCGQKPHATTLVLMTRDGDFGELIDELYGKKVDVCLVIPPSLNPLMGSTSLAQAVPENRRIRIPAHFHLLLSEDPSLGWSGLARLRQHL